VMRQTIKYRMDLRVFKEKDSGQRKCCCLYLKESIEYVNVSFLKILCLFNKQNDFSENANLKYNSEIRSEINCLLSRIVSC
jgi:hypothetical protein